MYSAVLPMMERHAVCIDADGQIVSPRLEGATLFGLVLDPSSVLRLMFRLKEGGDATLCLPRTTRMFLFPDLSTGTGFETRTEIFEMLYGPVTEETVISVVENLEVMGAQTQGVDRIVRASSNSLEWITVKGSSGLALSEAEPDELYWLYEA